MSYARSSLPNAVESSIVPNLPDLPDEGETIDEPRLSLDIVARLFDRQRKRYERRIEQLTGELRIVYGDRAELISKVGRLEAGRS